MDLINQPVVVFVLGGAAAGLVAWGAARTEIRFLWRDLRRLEARTVILERRGAERYTGGVS